MITDEYFQRESDRLIKLLMNMTDRQFLLTFKPQEGMEKPYNEVRFQLRTISTGRSLTYYNELIGKDPDDGCDRISDEKQSFVLQAARGIQWQ